MAETRVRLRDSTTVFLVGDIEATMEWYKQLGFQSEYYPPGFAILRRDQVEIFLQQQPGYVPPDDPGGANARRGTSTLSRTTSQPFTTSIRHRRA